MIKNNFLDLKSRELLLFNEEEMNPRKVADRDSVLTTFSPLADAILTTICEAGNSYLEFAEKHPIARQESTFPSSILHGLIIEGLSHIPGVRLTTVNKRNTIIEIGPFKVWVKKLDDRGLPWVNETMSSVKRAHQRAEGDDTLPVLILGYQLDQIERISKVELRYIEGDRQIWAPINLGNIAADTQSKLVSIPAVNEPEVVVKPGKKRERIVI